VLARESLRLLSIAMGLSVLAHVGLAYALAGQTWMTRAWPVFLIDILEHTAPRAEPRPTSARAASRELLPPRLAPRALESRPAVEPESREAPSPPRAVSDLRSALTPSVEAPAAATASNPATHPKENRADTSRDADASSPTGAAKEAASAPGISASATSSAPSARTPNEGVTRWARPRGGYQVYPSYPAAARRAGIEGTARLRVQVLADGRVGEILIDVSAGHAELDRAAADAVRQWRFEPARKGAEAVATWVLLPVEFHLE
jgi:protein TonB